MPPSLLADCAQVHRKAAGSGAALWLLVAPATALLASVLLGCTAGYLLTRLLRLRPSSIASLAGPITPGTGGGTNSSVTGGRAPPPPRWLRHPLFGQLRPALPLALSAATFAVAEAVGAEPLLTCVAAGLVASNWR